MVRKSLDLLLCAVCLLASACSPGGAPTTDVNSGSTAQWPPVSIPPDEFFLLVEDCLRDEGYAPVVDPEEHTVGFPGDQAGSREALQACIAEIDPSYLEPPPPFTEEQLADLYEYVTDQRDCYVELGYPRVELPSFELFSTDLEGRFHPAGVLASEFGQPPDAADQTTCRERSRPDWFDG